MIVRRPCPSRPQLRRPLLLRPSGCAGRPVRRCRWRTAAGCRPAAPPGPARRSPVPGQLAPDAESGRGPGEVADVAVGAGAEEVGGALDLDRPHPADQRRPGLRGLGVQPDQTGSTAATGLVVMLTSPATGAVGSADRPPGPPWRRRSRSRPPRCSRRGPRSGRPGPPRTPCRRPTAPAATSIASTPKTIRRRRRTAAPAPVRRTRRAGGRCCRWVLPPDRPPRRRAPAARRARCGRPRRIRPTPRRWDGAGWCGSPGWSPAARGDQRDRRSPAARRGARLGVVLVRRVVGDDLRQGRVGDVQAGQSGQRGQLLAQPGFATARRRAAARPGPWPGAAR